MTRRLAQALAMLVLFTPLGLVSAPQVHAQSATATPLEQVNIPNTPAGSALKAWLEAFNSGDRAQMDAYYQKYEPDKSAESIMPFRDMTGGFELIGIEKSERLQIKFRVKERNSETTLLGS